jgi:outer membrane protein assembly factor BamB
MTRPVVTDGAVYVGTGVVGESTAYAVDRETGEERWSVSGQEIAAATDDAVYVYDAGDVSSVSPADGTVRWTESGVTDVPEVAVAAGTVYGSAGVGRTAAFDAATGERLWRFRGETESMHVPSVGGDLVYVGSSPTEGRDGGNLYALDAASGELEWCAYLGFSSVASPAVADGTVFVPQGDGLVQARDAADGTLRWQFFERHAWFTDAAVVGSALFVGTEDGELFAFGETDG